MKRNQSKGNDVEIKSTILPKEENSCSKCWNTYSTEQTGDIAPRFHSYYFSENVYLTFPNKQQKILCQVARCPNCGNIKRDKDNMILFYKLNGNYGQRDYRNWDLLKENNITISQLERALIDWPAKKIIVLDPAKGLKYDNSLEPRKNETFTQYAYRYLYECKKANKWL